MAEGQTYIWAADATEASIRACAASASAAGGGEVWLPKGTITLTSALPIYSNVSYRGFGDGAIMTAPHYLAGGTILDGQSLDINGFEYNPTDKGSAYASEALLHASEAFNVSIHNLGIRNCKNGIKIGALYEGGVNCLHLDRVGVADCSEWGFWLENCHNLNVGRVEVYDCAVGQFMSTCSGAPWWNYGNDSIGQIISQQLGNTIRGRGVCIGARALSQRNDVWVGHITSIGGNTSYTIAPTCTNGSPDLGVTDLTKFAVGMPVIFQTGGSGFTANRAYFVTAVSGASGAGTIQVATSLHGAAVNATATGNTPTLITKGGAAIELAGYDATAYVNNLIVELTNTEACGVVDVLANRLLPGRVLMGTTTSASDTFRNQICCRGCDFRTSFYTLGKIGIFDSDAPTPRLDGMYYGAIVNQNVGGLRYDQTYSALTLWLDGKGKAFYPPDTTFVLNPIGMDRPLADKPSFIASGATINDTYGSLVIYTGAGGGSITLPAIFTQVRGLRYRIVNPSNGDLTVNTSSSQTINNVGAATSFVIAANSAADISACETSNGSGTFFWSKQ